MKGKVKFYDADKKFGYIIVEGSGKEVRINQYSFAGEPPSTNDIVEFEIDKKRDSAIKLKVVEKHKKGNHGAKKPRLKKEAPTRSKSIEYCLPGDTLKHLTISKIDNYALYLNKAAPYISTEKKFSFFHTKKRNIVINHVPTKAQTDKQETLMHHIQKRQDKAIKAMNLTRCAPLTLSPDWRLIIGLGTESVYETSITLHHIYGFPYVPGQAVKGVLRNCVIEAAFNWDEKEAIQSKLFCDMFGCPEQVEKQKSFYKKAIKGNLCFFDAFPTSPPKIEVDIMNPHYGDYYGSEKGEIPPADYLTPVPIPFLTVGSDSQFRFIIGIKEEKNIPISNYQVEKDTSLLNELVTCGSRENDNLITASANLLKEALEISGIGAKTSVGYGYMNLTG